ncbi:MAG: sigma-70 family RNA polymerase sigma factor [Phycisphaerae bacterium]
MRHARASSAKAASPPAGVQAEEESALVVRAQAGDRGAYGRLVLLYQDRLYNAVLRTVGDAEEAREITQEAFCRGLEKIEQFRGESGFYTWLFRVAINQAVSQLRKVQRRRTFSLDGAAGGTGGSNGQADLHEQRREPAPHVAMEDRERHAGVLAALGRLDAEYRALLVMRDIEGFDYKQIAEMLEMPLGTLKSRLFRARLALRDQLRQQLGPEAVR